MAKGCRPFYLFLEKEIKKSPNSLGKALVDICRQQNNLIDNFTPLNAWKIKNVNSIIRKEHHVPGSEVPLAV